MLGIIFAILFGTLLGSFLNVCIYRIPREASIVWPGSHCTSCKHDLEPIDLIPIFSFLFLKGRCRYCNKRISARYPFIELLTGILYGFIYYHFGLSIEAAMYALFAAVLLILAMIDLEHMILPTRIILFGAGMGLVFRILQAALYQELIYLWEPLLSGVLGYGLFYGIFYLSKLLLKKEGLGFGDVRLIGMIGVYLSGSLLFFTIFASSILASVYGLVVLCMNRESEPFPFGPFISGAALVALFYGYPLLEWYRHFMGLS